MPSHNRSSWKELVCRLVPDAETSPPADEGDLDVVEQSLGVALPPSLREFLAETNGFVADYGLHVVWPASEIVRQNQEFRTLESFRELYMPFDHLLLFGEDGGGDLFAFAIQADGQIHNFDIYLWEHETDARSWLAADLVRFLELRLLEREEEAE